ncbi:vitamin B12 transporter BtuB [Microbulbifer aestuariivivens]|uniref:Vitamin B12 transporter BtuB n=1 Tax=Microbulbifer aestuariivivens TaxID=1908308 RepID=A0ABP9WMC5_9GAMM
MRKIATLLSLSLLLSASVLAEESVNAAGDGSGAPALNSQQGPLSSQVTQTSLASQASQSSRGADRLEAIVVTASPQAKDRGEYSGSLSILKDGDLALISHEHIQQSLARIPGANVSRGNGQEYLPALRSPVLSGAGACGSILTMQDNIPLFPVGFCNINELFAAHSEQAQRLEVIRGPAGTLHGAGAMHGVINVVGISADADAPAQVRIGGGPEDRWKLNLRGNLLRGSGATLASALSLAQDGGYRAQSGFDQQKFSLVFRPAAGGPDAETRFSVTNLEQETAGYVVGEDAWRDPSLRRSNPNPEAYRDVRTARLSHSLTHITQGGHTVTVTPYARWGEMALLQHFLPGQPLEETEHVSVGFRSHGYGNVGASLAVSAGLDGELTHASLRQFQVEEATGSAFLQETLPQGLQYDYEVRSVLLSPFLLMAYSPSAQLSLEAGLRLQAQRYEYDNRMLAGRTREDGSPCGFGGCRYSRPADRADDFENWSPSVGLFYDWAPQHQVFANLAHGFRAPQATELYRLQREQNVADLDSEALRSLEVGLRGRQGPLGYELVTYAMEKRNVIFRDTDFFNRSGGATSHRGAELALGYALGRRWSLDLAASYAEHRYRDKRLLDGIPLDGNLVDSAPRAFGSARLNWQPDERSQLELEWLHQGRYYTDPLNLHSYPGHDLLNVRARRSFDEGWALALRVLNLLDERYAERADFSSFSGDRYFPGEPRAIYAELELDF